MSTFLAITFTGLALGAIYFLISSGLSLIYGLMDVLNFAQGVFLTLGAYAGWAIASYLPTSFGAPLLFVLAIFGAILGGTLVALATEVLLIRPLYGKPVSQILVTVGLDLALVGLLFGAFGSNSQAIPVPAWLTEATTVGSEHLPNADFLAIAAGIGVLVGLGWFLGHTRYGLIIRAGVENREMVSALGIDVGRAFTLVFMIGGAAAGLAGLLYAVVFGGLLVSPTEGDQLLIFAFIVVVIGGLGSLRGSAIAALVVGLIQDYVGFYLGAKSGFAEVSNLSVVLLLAVVLQLRPQGLLGRRLLAGQR